MCACVYTRVEEVPCYEEIHEVQLFVNGGSDISVNIRITWRACYTRVVPDFLIQEGWGEA